MNSMMRCFNSCVELTRRTVFGGEHKRAAAVRLSGQPRLGLPRDVRRVIVQNDLDRSCGRVGSVEDIEEFDELATAMAVLDQRVHRKTDSNLWSHFQGGERFRARHSVSRSTAPAASVLISENDDFAFPAAKVTSLAKARASREWLVHRGLRRRRHRFGDWRRRRPPETD